MTEGRTTMSDETWVAWEKCGPFEWKEVGQSGCKWTIEERTPNGHIIVECYEEPIADQILADHAAARQVELMREALDRIARHCDSGHPDWKQDHYGIAKIAADALAALEPAP